MNISYRILQPHFSLVLALGQLMQSIELNTKTMQVLHFVRLSSRGSFSEVLQVSASIKYIHWQGTHCFSWGLHEALKDWRSDFPNCYFYNGVTVNCIEQIVVSNNSWSQKQAGLFFFAICLSLCVVTCRTCSLHIYRLSVVCFMLHLLLLFFFFVSWANALKSVLLEWWTAVPHKCCLQGFPKHC